MADVTLRLRFRIEWEDEREPDELGRRHFSMHWKYPGRRGRRRAQHFFANPEEHARRLRAEGHKVSLPVPLAVHPHGGYAHYGCRCAGCQPRPRRQTSSGQ